MQGGPRTKTVFAGAAAFVGALFLGLVTTYLVERTFGERVVERNVILGGRVVSGKSGEELRAVLVGIEAKLRKRSFDLSWRDARLVSPAAALGLSVDVERGIQMALAPPGRDSLFSGFGFWMARLFGAHRAEIPYVVDRKVLSATLTPWADKHLPVAKLPEISFSNELVVERGHPGSVIDLAVLAQNLLAAARDDSTTSVVVESIESQPVIAPAIVEARVERAKALLEGPIQFRVEGAEGGEEVLSPTDLGPALSSTVDEGAKSFTLDLDVTLIRERLSDFLAEHEKAPVEAGFEFSPRGEVTITPSAPGTRVDDGALVEAIWKAVETQERTAPLPLVVALPKLTTEKAETLGVKELVGSFVTHHACCQPRVENIHKAAAVLDGTVLLPGEKFSLNDLLGPRTKAAGYRAAPTIVRGEMEDVYGGGISQLATTLFNAVLRSGYEITQRQPHSIYFSRYPEGHEATVSYPEPDLAFRNDTKAGMVIKTQYTGTFIKVLVYGDDEGRVVSVNKGRRTNIKKPPTEYEPDEEMPPEKSKRVRAGQLGWTVLVSRTVKYADGSKKEEKREVVYNPRPELVRVHPCQIPEGEEGHTGEECPEPEREEREEVLSDDVYYDTIGSADVPIEDEGS